MYCVALSLRGENAAIRVIEDPQVCAARAARAGVEIVQLLRVRIRTNRKQYTRGCREFVLRAQNLHRQNADLPVDTRDSSRVIADRADDS